MSKAPDFKLVVGRRYDPERGDRQPTRQIGVAWKIVKDGNLIGVNIKLDDAIPPMSISSEYDLTLWRNDGERKGRGGSSGSSNVSPPPQDEFGDDDIPF